MFFRVLNAFCAFALPTAILCTFQFLFFTSQVQTLLHPVYNILVTPIDSTLLIFFLCCYLPTLLLPKMPNTTPHVAAYGCFPPEPCVFWDNGQTKPSLQCWLQWHKSFKNYIKLYAKLCPDATLDTSSQLMLWWCFLGEERQRYYDSLIPDSIVGIYEVLNLLEKKNLVFLVFNFDSVVIVSIEHYIILGVFIYYVMFQLNTTSLIRMNGI